MPEGLHVEVEVDGVVVSRGLIAEGSADFLGERDARLCAEACRAGKVYRVIITDPDDDVGAFVISNDPSHMKAPITIDDFLRAHGIG